MEGRKKGRLIRRRGGHKTDGKVLLGNSHYVTWKKRERTGPRRAKKCNGGLDLELPIKSPMNNRPAGGGAQSNTAKEKSRFGENSKGIMLIGSRNRVGGGGGGGE